MTPSIVVKPGEGMHFQGFYNQLKQEYASARYLYYEGTTPTTPHFSDKGVLLINTLDYPCYSLAVEKMKMAFRMAYSLLDKVAYFLNDHLALGVPERKVNCPLILVRQARALNGDFYRRSRLATTGRFVGCSG